MICGEEVARGEGLLALPGAWLLGDLGCEVRQYVFFALATWDSFCWIAAINKFIILWGKFIILGGKFIILWGTHSPDSHFRNDSFSLETKLLLLTPKKANTTVFAPKLTNCFLWPNIQKSLFLTKMQLPMR